MGTATSTDIADRLITATGQIRRALRRADETSAGLDGQSNLTLSQEAVMGHLLRGGAMSTADLARMEGVRPQSMGLTVGGLEDLGLIAKTPDPEDARRSLVELTDEGRSSRDQARGRRTGILARRLDDRLSADELACLDRALSLLDRVVEH
jgi:DNA-binding MarR family transcriptional regulator